MYNGTSLDGGELVADIFGKQSLWTTRFPLIWQRMKDMDLNTGAKFAEHIAKVDPQLSVSEVINLIQGVVAYFNPEQYSDNWHPDALRLSKVLGRHVSRLFPIPDDWAGPRMNTPERREYLQYRERFQKSVQESGFSSLTDFAKSLGVGLSALNGIVTERQGNYKLNGEWRELSQIIAEGLHLMPEELFGKPEAWKEARRQWKLAAQSAPALLPDSVDPHGNHNADLDRDTDFAKVKSGVSQTLLTLSAREQFILSMRYGLGGLEHEHTLKQVAEKMDITSERIRQMEMRAIRKLRHHSRRLNLSRYFDVYEP